MHRTSAELQLQPFTLTLPAYRIEQLRQLAEQTNAQHVAQYGVSYGISAEATAAALLIQALDRISAEATN